MVRFFSLLVVATVWAATFAPAAAQRFRAVVPYDLEHGKPVATVEVNGQRARFLIDTGGPCSVSHTLAQRLGLRPIGAHQGHDSNGQPLDVQIARFDSLRLGGVTFSALDAVMWRESDPIEQFGVDGIVGFNLLQMGILKLSHRDRKAIFTTVAEGLGPDSVQPLAMLPDPFVPLVALRIGEHAVDTVMFDSGAQSLYEMSQRAYSRLAADTAAVRHLATGFGILSMGAAGVEPPSVKHRLLLPELRVGDGRFAQLTTITTDGLDSRLGADLLHWGDVAIDYRRGLFYFLPFNRAARPNLHAPEWDVGPIMTNGQITAGMVWDESLPIRCGDRITAVNGRPSTPPAPGQMPSLSMPGDAATLTFLSAATGRESTITIRRR